MNIPPPPPPINALAMALYKTPKQSKKSRFLHALIKSLKCTQSYNPRVKNMMYGDIYSS